MKFDSLKAIFRRKFNGFQNFENVITVISSFVHTFDKRVFYDLKIVDFERLKTSQRSASCSYIF